MKFMKSHPTKLYISWNTEPAWFVRLKRGEKETCQGRKSPFSHVFKGSCQLFSIFKIATVSDKVKKMCQNVLFDLFLVALMGKELNRLEHMLYLRGGGWRSDKWVGLRFESAVWLKAATKTSDFTSFPKEETLVSHGKESQLCPSEVRANLSA